MEIILEVKFHFPAPEAAREALPSMRSFLKEGVEAYDFWRQNNNGTGNGNFWQQFTRKFPETAGYLMMGDGAPIHSLAGKIGFGDMANLDTDLVAKGRCIKIKTQAWGLLDREPLFEFMVKRFGALRQTSREIEEYTDIVVPLSRLCILKKGGVDRAFHTNV